MTNGQISTLHFIYSRYPFKTSMPNNVKSFGMWLPTTDPAGGVLLSANRVKGQENAAGDAPMLSQVGAAGVSALFMGDPGANPLDYKENAVTRRRQEVSAILDSANPDLTRFHRRGGKLIVTIGTNDTLASPGAQLDYYQSVIDKMGQATVDQFARFFVIPQTGHGLSGANYSIDGQGKTISTAPIPNTFNRLAVLIDWVEKKVVPGKSLTVTAGTRSLPLCSYPAYPRYVSGDTTLAASYTCAPVRRIPK
jgi:feruloyl esterase